MSDAVDPETWARVLGAIDADAPPALEVADALASATGIAESDAYDRVTDAIDAGVLREEGEGFGGIRLADAETSESSKPDKNGREEAGASTPTPGLEGGKSGEKDGLEERAHAAFADAIEFYHNQLETELPVEYADTARDYYENVRGWSTDTVEEKLLGYAPGDCRDELIAYLHRNGHGRDAIQACGLFYEDDLCPHFNGRFVLPYFDEDGAPVYAISRSIDEDSDGHPDDHHGDQKYTKAIKGKDYSVMDEPIYGADTLDEDTDRLLVAGGIADAITLHEAGYACISPVTTVRFKSKHEPVVVELVEKYDLDGVYMLNDAERPSSDKTDLSDGEEADTIGDVLTIKQYGEGERGAFGNAEFLLDEGVDPYLVRLPGGDGDLRKLDPDDYLKEGWGSVDTLLRSARHAEDHVGYSDWSAQRRSREIDKAIATGDGASCRSSSDGTDLYNLEFTDVSDMDVGDRQNNPLGHHGGSEGYFTCSEKNGFVHGYDHKYNVAYNAVSFLLCDAGERRADDPNGRLSDREVFVAWKHAKANNHLPDDDPVPYRGLLGIALADGLLDRDDLVVRDADTGDVVETPDDHEGETYDAFPPGAYAEVLEHVRDEHGVDPGREVPEYDGEGETADAEPVAVLPNTPVDRADQFGILRADRRDGGDPMQERRDRTAEEIERVYRSGDRALVEALPTLGKTYGAVKAAAESNTQVSIFTTRGRKEQYAEIKRVCEEHGLEPLVLPAFTHDCETANGTHGEEIAETVRGWYHSGATPKQIHKYAEDVLGKQLPCHADGRRCSYAAKWDFDPDEFDVLIGHYAHAHKRKTTQGRAVVFDEFPGGAFETTLAGEHELAGAVSTFLNRTPQVPYEDFADLIEGRHLDAERRSDALAFLVDDLEPDPHEAFDGRSGHAYAPLVVFTLLASNDLGNGWEAATFPDGGRIGLYDRSNNRVHIRTAPNLKFASSVAALDGTPTKELWELALDERLNHRPVLQEGEREEYLDDVLGLNIVRTTEAVKPYAGGEYVNTDQDLALLEAIADRHDTAPGVISSRSALDQYAEAGALEFDPEDGSVTDGPADRVKWYGNVLGSNEFKRTRVGAVIGSNHYGDGFIQKWGAYAGEAVERGDEKGAGLSYGSFGDKVLTHMREHETLQATMRFGRDGKGATVYVHTDTLPEWVPTAGEGRVINTWSDGMKQVLEAADDLGATFRTAELVDHPDVEIGRRQVFDHLATLAERGYLDREHEGRGYTWRDDGLHRVNDHGDTELEPVDVDDLDDDGFRELARSSVNTWEFTNSPGVPPDPSPQRPGEASVAATSAGNGGDRGDHEPE